MLAVVAYVLALPIILLTSTVLLFLLVLCSTTIAPGARKLHVFAITESFVVALVSVGLAVLAFIGLCSLVGVTPVLGLEHGQDARRMKSSDAERHYPRAQRTEYNTLPRRHPCHDAP